jgi:hypothetical protein
MISIAIITETKKMEMDRNNKGILYICIVESQKTNKQNGEFPY